MFQWICCCMTSTKNLILLGITSFNWIKWGSSVCKVEQNCTNMHVKVANKSRKGVENKIMMNVTSKLPSHQHNCRYSCWCDDNLEVKWKFGSNKSTEHAVKYCKRHEIITPIGNSISNRDSARSADTHWPVRFLGRRNHVNSRHRMWTKGKTKIKYSFEQELFNTKQINFSNTSSNKQQQITKNGNVWIHRTRSCGAKDQGRRNMIAIRERGQERRVCHVRPNCCIR